MSKSHYIKNYIILDNYMVNHVRYAWQRDHGVSVLDKELSQYIVTDVKTNKKDVTYSIGNVVIPYMHIYIFSKNKLVFNIPSKLFQKRRNKHFFLPNNLALSLYLPLTRYLLTIKGMSNGFPCRIM